MKVHLLMRKDKLSNRLRKVWNNVEECMRFAWMLFLWLQLKVICWWNHACALSYTGVYTDCSDNIVYNIPFMASTNIMTGYTYI